VEDGGYHIAFALHRSADRTRDADV